MIHTHLKVHSKHVGAQAYLVPWVCGLDSWENFWLLSIPINWKANLRSNSEAQYEAGAHPADPQKIPSWATALCWNGEILASEQQHRKNYFLVLSALFGSFSARFLVLCQCLCSTEVWLWPGERQTSCTSLCAELEVDGSNLLWIPPAAWQGCFLQSDSGVISPCMCCRLKPLKIPCPWRLPGKKTQGDNDRLGLLR